MDDTTQHIEVNGMEYFVMSKELFDLRIRNAYINGEIHAYRNVRDGTAGAVRIDELKMAAMTDNKKHHAKLDELIEEARKEMHRMMDRAMLSGAVSDEMLRPDTYFLARSIITIYGDERNHAPPSIIMNKEIDDLAKAIE